MLDIKQFKDGQSRLWDKLVEKANNGTIFHTRRFLSYHPQNRFTDHSLIFYKNNQPFVLFPAAAVQTANGQFLISHPGATYGSFVVPENLSFSDSYKLVETLISYARQARFNGIRLTIPPTIYNRRLSNYVDFALLQHGFRYIKRELSSILFLEQSVEDNLVKFKSSHRQAVRKAQREGVHVKQSEDLESFYNILQNNLKIRHNVSPTHTLKELKILINLFPENIRLYGAYLHDRMVAGTVNFICNKDVVLAFYISHDEAFQKSRALNLLFYTIFDWAIREEFKVFDFGIFTVHEEPNFGLARFKENFGASGMFRDTLEREL